LSHGLRRHLLHRLGDLLRLLWMTARYRTFIGEPLERGQLAMALVAATAMQESAISSQINQ